VCCITSDPFLETRKKIIHQGYQIPEDKDGNPLTLRDRDTDRDTDRGVPLHKLYSLHRNFPDISPSSAFMRAEQTESNNGLEPGALYNLSLTIQDVKLRRERETLSFHLFLFDTKNTTLSEEYVFKQDAFDLNTLLSGCREREGAEDGDGDGDKKEVEREKGKEKGKESKKIKIQKITPLHVIFRQLETHSMNNLYIVIRVFRYTHTLTHTYIPNQHTGLAICYQTLAMSPQRKVQ